LSSHDTLKQSQGRRALSAQKNHWHGSNCD
jgi:hypothetical protein